MRRNRRVCWGLCHCTAPEVVPGSLSVDTVPVGDMCSYRSLDYPCSHTAVAIDCTTGQSIRYTSLVLHLV